MFTVLQWHLKWTLLQSKKEPLVPIGCAVTVGFLLAGFRAFTGGNQKLSQHLMRGRVVAQVRAWLHYFVIHCRQPIVELLVL
jgi:Hypoxia induced protein conserved region